MKKADARLHERLAALIATSDLALRRDADPVGFVHGYSDPSDQEVVALVSALLAFGNVTTIRKKVSEVLHALGQRPSVMIEARSRAELERDLKGFVHRVWNARDVAGLLSNAASVRRASGSLGSAFQTHLQEADAHHSDPDESFVEALARLADALRGPKPPKGLAHLVPDPRRGSACKRLLLYMRWMVRPADGVDLGLWDVPTSRLLIPVDTHIQRIGQNLRLTSRTDASLRTSLEITRALRRLDPSDPVRFDFALCHMGVSRECPSRRDATKCARCELRSVCKHWAMRGT